MSQVEMGRQHSADRSVAVIGAGPGGIVAAKYLAAQGFTPVIFEQSADIGGQWNVAAAHSAVWPSMCANSSRALTCFSDLAYPPGTPVFPSNRQVHDYLRAYAHQFSLLDQVRLHTRVQLLEQGSQGGWHITSAGPDGATRREAFARVVVASGRYHRPAMPDIPGLDTSATPISVSHSSAYRGPTPFRGQRVLVCGSSISALEIASDLALSGIEVIATCRTQRYVLQKLLAGVPADNVAFTRFGALAAESLPPQHVAHMFRSLIVGSCGSPEQFGAPVPPENIFAAGITQSQHYLSLVAEGRIAAKLWPIRIDGNLVQFADGDTEAVDAMIFATGYALDLPFLSEDLRATLKIGGHDLDLYRFTFHPDFDGLAFIGMYCASGPQLPILELQARWLTYAWAGLRTLPPQEEMARAIATARPQPPSIPMQVLALLFAREAGVEPDLAARPDLLPALLFGPLTPISFRLNGPDCLAEAAEGAVEAARMHGALSREALSPDQHEMVRALASARGDSALASIVASASSAQ